MFEVKAICNGEPLINLSNSRILLSSLPSDQFVDGFKSALSLIYTNVKVVIETLEDGEFSNYHRDMILKRK